MASVLKENDKLEVNLDNQDVEDDAITEEAQGNDGAAKKKRKKKKKSGMINTCFQLLQAP